MEMPIPDALVIDPETYRQDPSRYRRRFLRAIRETTPEVLKALRDDVFPLYTSSALFRAVSVKLAFVKAKPGTQPATPAQIEAFRRTLDQWGQGLGCRTNGFWRSRL